MPSVSLQTWQSIRATSLDEIEEAHRSIGGTGPGRRYATQQINQAYAVMLSGQFQAFCRDLHTEALIALTQAIQPVALRPVIQDELSLFRRLDRGNPTPGNIGADFNRLGVDLWAEVRSKSKRAKKYHRDLEKLMEWRNAIAHQDFDPNRLGASNLTLRQVRSWRGSCDALTRLFDAVVAEQIAVMTGRRPW